MRQIHVRQATNASCKVVKPQGARRMAAYGRIKEKHSSFVRVANFRLLITRDGTCGARNVLFDAVFHIWISFFFFYFYVRVIWFVEFLRFRNFVFRINSFDFYWMIIRKKRFFGCRLVVDLFIWLIFFNFNFIIN